MTIKEYKDRIKLLENSSLSGYFRAKKFIVFKRDHENAVKVMDEVIKEVGRVLL